MHTSHDVKLGKGMEARYYDNFPTVELSDQEATLYIPQKCWKKLIAVLEKAQAVHEAHEASKNNQA